MSTLHGFYIIADKFFTDFPNQPYLKGNKEENRPHYYSFKEEKEDIIWVIPLSKRIEKYKKIINQKEQQNKPCDGLHIAIIAGKESAFLIQDMFPITEEYILREYTVAGQPLILVGTTDAKIIEKKAKKVHSLLMYKNYKFTPTQPDVKGIRNILLEKNHVVN